MYTPSKVGTGKYIKMGGLPVTYSASSTAAASQGQLAGIVPTAMQSGTEFQQLHYNVNLSSISVPNMGNVCLMARMSTLYDEIGKQNFAIDINGVCLVDDDDFEVVPVMLWSTGLSITSQEFAASTYRHSFLGTKDSHGSATGGVYSFDTKAVLADTETYASYATYIGLAFINLGATKTALNAIVDVSFRYDFVSVPTC